MKWVTFFLFLLGSFFQVASAEASPRTFDWGFFASRVEDANGDQRFRLLGPLYEHTESPLGQDLFAVRPFYSRVVDPEADRLYRDILWPLGSAAVVQDMYSWRFLLAYEWSRKDAEPQQHRFWILPFYFQGRDRDGISYRGLFPVAGTIRDFLARDEIQFLIFPLYSSSRVDTVESHSYLWPFTSFTTGKGIERTRIFPFYGKSKHRDDFEKKFILWPFWTSVDYHYPSSSGSGFILFPFYGRMDLTDQQTRWVLPPFFRWTKAKDRNLTYCPWPIYQRVTGDIDKLYIFPLWGRKTQENAKTGFFIWPLFRHQRYDRDTYVRKRFFIAPLIKKESDYEKEADGTLADSAVRSNFLFWPLFSWQRNQESSRFRTLELWPLGNSPPVERSLAPFWTLFSRTTRNEKVDTELLWGLYRSEQREDNYKHSSFFPFYESTRSGEDKRSWSLLKGLVGYERDASNKVVRLLYFIRLGRTPDNQP